MFAMKLKILISLMHMFPETLLNLLQTGQVSEIDFLPPEQTWGVTSHFFPSQTESTPPRLGQCHLLHPILAICPSFSLACLKLETSNQFSQILLEEITSYQAHHSR